MSDGQRSSGGLKSPDQDLDKEVLRRVRERVLEAEKNKLHLDLPRGINNEIEQIIREEVD